MPLGKVLQDRLSGEDQDSDRVVRYGADTAFNVTLTLAINIHAVWCVKIAKGQLRRTHRRGPSHLHHNVRAEAIIQSAITATAMQAVIAMNVEIRQRNFAWFASGAGTASSGLTTLTMP